MMTKRSWIERWRIGHELTKMTWKCLKLVSNVSSKSSCLNQTWNFDSNNEVTLNHWNLLFPLFETSVKTTLRKQKFREITRNFKNLRFSNSFKPSLIEYWENWEVIEISWNNEITLNHSNLLFEWFETSWFYIMHNR